jgi:hypothetical protein
MVAPSSKEGLVSSSMASSVAGLRGDNGLRRIAIRSFRTRVRMNGVEDDNG